MSATRAVLARVVALSPTRADLAAMRRTPRRDLLAGLTVGVVALPLALGFGISSGLGAQAGVVTAIVAGLAAALLGGSNLQVSGPTGAMTVVLIPIVAAYGASGVLVVGLMAGVLLLAMAVAGVGRYVRFIPLPVVEGFTLGIAVIIALQQVPSALGVHASGRHVLGTAVDAVGTWMRDPHGWALGVTVGVVAVMLGTARLRPSLPASLIAVVAATALTAGLDLDVATIGALPSAIPAPQLPVVPWGRLDQLLLPAVAVAVLAALESLLSASVADAMSVSERHDPDRELFGQGMANLVSPLFGGLPATAAIARTAVNVRSGAASRLASVVHALFLLVVVLVLAPVVGHIPLAALAGVLIATALRMVEVGSVRALIGAGRGDALVLVGTAVATVAFDLVTAVVFGVVAAGAVALRRMAESTVLERTGIHEPGEPDEGDEMRALLDEHVVAFRLEGPLFFAAAHRALLELSTLSDVRVVVLRMSRVQAVDVTGAAVLRDTITRLEAHGTTVLLSGVRERQSRVLQTLGVYASLAHEGHLFATTPEAIAHARVHAAHAPHAVPTP